MSQNAYPYGCYPQTADYRYPQYMPSPQPGGTPGTMPGSQMQGFPMQGGQQQPGMQGFPMLGGQQQPGMQNEESYIENILRLNLGKTGTFYMTYENNTQWNAKIFKGKIEAAGRDHIIISDTQTGQRILLLMVNLDYVTFDQPLNYFNSSGAKIPGTR